MNNSRKNPMQTETMSNDNWFKMEGKVRSRNTNRSNRSNRSQRANNQKKNTPPLITNANKKPLIFSFDRNTTKHPTQFVTDIKWVTDAYNSYDTWSLKNEGCLYNLKEHYPESCVHKFSWKPTARETVMVRPFFKDLGGIAVLIIQPSWNNNKNYAFYVIHNDNAKEFLDKNDEDKYELISAAADAWNPAKPVSSAFSAKPVSSAFSLSYATNTSMFSNLPNSKSNPTTTNQVFSPHFANSSSFMSDRERAMAAARAKAANGSNNNNNNNNSTNGGRRKKTRRTRRTQRTRRNRSFRK